MNNNNKLISLLDSERYGFKIAKMHNFKKDNAETVKRLKKIGVKMIIARVSGEKIEIINNLEDLGFRVKDNQLTYRYDLKKFDKKSIPNYDNMIIKDVKKTDIPELVRFTKKSFNGYGHYFADNKLDNKKSREIYKDWVYRSCTDSRVADKVIVAEINNEIAGYLTFKIYKKNNFNYAAGGLGTVVEKFRNKSVFQAITLHGLSWGFDLKLDWEEHNVLATNYSVNRAFSKLGFRITESFVTMHNWL